MRCSNRNCNRYIGLLSHRRGWFSKERYCSKYCRYACLADRPKQSQQERRAMTYFEWLFSQPIDKPQQPVMRVLVRTRAR
jgi:hypothetical protein